MIVYCVLCNTIKLVRFIQGFHIHCTTSTPAVYQLKDSTPGPLSGCFCVTWIMGDSPDKISDAVIVMGHLDLEAFL